MRLFRGRFRSVQGRVGDKEPECGRMIRVGRSGSSTVQGRVMNLTTGRMFGHRLYSLVLNSKLLQPFWIESNYFISTKIIEKIVNIYNTKLILL